MLGIPHMREEGPDAEGGRGFRLVNQIAQRWGSAASQAFLLLGRSRYLRPGAPSRARNRRQP